MTLYPDRTFDAEKDFVPIGMVNITSNVMAGRPELPANNFKELLSWMKQPGQTIKIGHPGVGSFGHLAEVLIFQELGVKVTQVPYREPAPRWSICWAGRLILARSRPWLPGPWPRAAR
jgi:tripartite-type tricarboxylate transporter receptor subunit TctC